ncbi:M24 family metallopeptidase [Corynebacterium sp. TAE3-ERU12]|uniref:M24 family metallopeptidase n=1 Tax=Corynebacterium sp. TAE3-ERU12 TaxID=2849491 RepID=UPI00351D8075
MPVPAIDYSSRRARVAKALAEHDVDAIVVARPEHVRWLTGFTGSNSAVVIDASATAAFATDSRYTSQAAEQVPDLQRHITRECASFLVDSFAKREQPFAEASGTRIGVEAEHLSVAAFHSLRDGAAEGIVVTPVTGVIAELRKVKDEVELELLRTAADIAAGAYAELLADGGIAAGRTEREVAADLEYRMRLRGADKPSFDTIVASGPNSALPHHGAGDRVLQTGDLVTVDFGALAHGYCSDMTRTSAVGGAAALDDFSREIYSVVLRAQLAGVEAARPGAQLAEIDAVCRESISAAGYGEYFVHSTGHGIGIDVHEPPYAATRGTGALQPGMTLTIEPGVYVPGRGGVRIEDTLIITDGEPENLVNLPKTLS